jgi:hypothetical protein
MYLQFECSEVIDRSMFRLFTRNGERLDYMVWPALLLHENGPLVQKGVVQPVHSKSGARNSKPKTKKERTKNK